MSIRRVYTVETADGSALGLLDRVTVIARSVEEACKKALKDAKEVSKNARIKSVSTDENRLIE